MINNLPLNKFCKNIHSQNGEDGIIAEILNNLKLSTKKNLWCVEFGAWDGIYLSNTFALVENGWNALYIEGEPERYQDLLKTKQKFPKIFPVEAFVARYSGEKNSLDNILAKSSIPKDFEVLSIDIDSYDCDVWQSLTNYEPKIVIIEINSSAPPGVLWRHGNKTQGNTFSSTLSVGVKKGYTLVCHTGNLIFVKSNLVDKLKIPKRYIDYPELLFINSWLPNDLFKQVTNNSSIRAIIPKPLRLLAKKIKNLKA
jgi:hypothetical protein